MNENIVIEILQEDIDKAYELNGQGNPHSCVIAQAIQRQFQTESQSINVTWSDKIDINGRGYTGATQRDKKKIESIIERFDRHGPKLTPTTFRVEEA